MKCLFLGLRVSNRFQFPSFKFLLELGHPSQRIKQKGGQVEDPDLLEINEDPGVFEKTMFQSFPVSCCLVKLFTKI